MAETLNKKILVVWNKDKKDWQSIESTRIENRLRYAQLETIKEYVYVPQAQEMIDKVCKEETIK